jgi:hypothetical protein
MLYKKHYETSKDILTFYKRQNPFEGNRCFYFFLQFFLLLPFAILVVPDISLYGTTAYNLIFIWA